MSNVYLRIPVHFTLWGRIKTLFTGRTVIFMSVAQIDQLRAEYEMQQALLAPFDTESKVN